MKTFAILCLLGAALAAPAPQVPCPSQVVQARQAPQAGQAPQAPQAPQAGQAPQADQGAGGNCADIQSKLAKGIQANLDIQAAELKGVYALKLQAGTAGFNTTQQSVLSIQKRGVDIRANNQKLAAQIKSPAADGLAIVAGAQTKEIGQVQSLKGTGADAPVIAMLVQEVMDGTMQNQKNLAAAKGQVCAK